MYRCSQIDSIVVRRHEISKKMRLANKKTETVAESEPTLNPNSSESHEEEKSRTLGEMKAMQDGFQQTLNAKNEEIASLKREKEEYEAKYNEALREAELLRGKWLSLKSSADHVRSLICPIVNASINFSNI